MLSSRPRAGLVVLAVLMTGGGLASAGWVRHGGPTIPLWGATDGRPVLSAADLIRKVQDGQPLGTEDGWTIRRVLVRIDRAVLIPDNHTEAAQVEGDYEITFRVPSKLRAEPGTTMVVWACLRDWDGRQLALGLVCPE